MRPYRTAGTTGPAGIAALQHSPGVRRKSQACPGGYKIRPYRPAPGLLVGAALPSVSLLQGAGLHPLRVP